MFGRRPDATAVRELPAVRAFMPFVSPRRNHSLVYFTQDLEVDAALAFLEGWNRGRDSQRRLTFFHLFLRGLARVIDERPRLNRFVAGGRLWQRDGIWLSFAAKKRMDDDAPFATVKLRVDPHAPLEDWLEQMHGALSRGRSDEKATTDREMDLLLRLPAPLVSLVIAGVRALDYLGLLPRAMIDPDPLYASAFVANLGSVGLDAGYHHLWEYGNVPIFAVLGRLRSDADGVQRVTIKYSYDERVEDGLYCATSLERLRALLEKPSDLV